MASFWDSVTPYLGPIGYGVDKIRGKDRSFTDYLDPGDITGRQSAQDQKDAAAKAQAYLEQLSGTAWDRQMQGLQLALGSTNNLGGWMAQRYGMPSSNYYDPSLMGGIAQQLVPGGRPGVPQAAPPPPPASTGPAAEPRKGYGHF